MFTFPKALPRVFKNMELQKQFERDGFVRVPFYSSEQIASIQAVYEKIHPQQEAGFFPSTFSQDKAYRKQAEELIREISESSLSGLFCDFQVVSAAFIVKKPTPDSGMCVHQDMSLVDESRFAGINIWTPLVDTTVQNGALFVIPGSHRWVPTYRGSSIPEFFSTISDAMLDYLQPQLLKAGEAVIFDQSIIHYSPPNYGAQSRVVTNIYITHQEAEFRTYYFDPSQPGEVEVYAQNVDFMQDYDQFGQNIHQRPQVGKRMENVSYDFPKIDLDFVKERAPKTDARTLILKARETNVHWWIQVKNWLGV